MVKIKAIAFDFDGVIADTNKEKIKWLKSRGINIENADKSSFFEILGKTDKTDKLYKMMSKDIFTPQVLKNTQPIKDSIKVIKKLSIKYDIYIITARTEEMIIAVKDWLKIHNINNNIKQIISSSFGNKQDICFKNNISFLCDDDLRHLIENKIETRVLFKSGLSVKDSNIISTDSWKEIEEILFETV